MTTYYALEDRQTGGNLIHSGRNTTSKEELKDHLLSYYSADHEAGDLDTMTGWTAEQLADYGEFAIVSSDIPFEEVL